MRRKPSGAAAAHSGYAVSRVIQALEALVEGPISATVLADRLGVHTRTARRLLQRLVEDGYAVRGTHNLDGFHPSPALSDLGRRLADAPICVGWCERWPGLPLGTDHTNMS